MATRLARLASGCRLRRIRSADPKGSCFSLLSSFFSDGPVKLATIEVAELRVVSYPYRAFNFGRFFSCYYAANPAACDDCWGSL